MAEIVNVTTKTPPVESLTVKFSRAEVNEIIEGLDYAQRGHRYYFNFTGGRSLIASKLEKALKNTPEGKKVDPLTDSVSAMLRSVYA